MKIVGLTGPNGSGKSYVASYLEEEHGFTKISMGDIVREFTRKEGLETNRENLHIIQDRYRSKHGAGFFAREVAKKIKASDDDLYVVEGIRLFADYKPLEEEFGDDFVFILVNANPHIRFERMKERGRPGDPDNFEEFQVQEGNEFREFELRRIFKETDYTIRNDTGLEELYEKIEKFLNKYNII